MYPAVSTAVVLVCLFADDLPEFLLFGVHIAEVAGCGERLFAADARGYRSYTGSY